MKKISSLFFIVLFAAATLSAQQSASLERKVLEIQRDPAFRHGTLSVCVYNVSKGRQVYAYNEQMSMPPASVMKLFTTGTGFARLGSDFRFTTQLAIRGEIDRDGVLHGNVYITGGGDPLLGSYRYRQTSPDSLFDGWMKALRYKGVRRIDGRICFNVEVFDEQPLHNTWQWGDVGNYYAAGVSGLNFHENMYFVYFAPGNRQGLPAAAVRTQPKNIDVRGLSEVTTGPAGSGDNVIIYGSPTEHIRHYRGTVPMGKGEFAVRGALPNPARQCADLFASYLRTHGISISSNSMQVYSQPDSLRPLLDYRSTDYYTIAQYTNLTSNNVYAESIFKYLGYKAYGKGTFENGAKAVNDYFRELHLETSGIKVVDGSGLSRSNRVTTDFLCRYLMAVARQPFFDLFHQSLAKVGESGTAKNLVTSLPAGVSMRVKTGTMDGVKAYAGYIDAANGDRLAFAIIVGGYDATPRVVTDRLGKILSQMATLY